MIAILSSFWFRRQSAALNWFLPVLVAAGLPLSTSATVSANLTWTTSPDASVTGYKIYYGGASHQYASSVSVGNVSNTVIPNLVGNTIYFFAAKAHNDAGLESDFSNEAAFMGITTTPDTSLRLKTLPINFTGNPLRFSLDAGAPVGATINPTNGVVYWTPGRIYASTTNYINVIATDTINPALSISVTFAREQSPKRVEISWKNIDGARACFLHQPRLINDANPP